jgi:hypothetical protein
MFVIVTVTVTVTPIVTLTVTPIVTVTVTPIVTVTVTPIVTVTVAADSQYMKSCNWTNRMHIYQNNHMLLP